MYCYIIYSPDIIPLFTDGVDHAVSFTYGAHEEDFGATNLSKLDTWVFEEFETFLSNCESVKDSCESLHGDKVVFFLHLLVILCILYTHLFINLFIVLFKTVIYNLHYLFLYILF